MVLPNSSGIADLPAFSYVTDQKYFEILNIVVEKDGESRLDHRMGDERVLVRVKQERNSLLKWEG